MIPGYRTAPTAIGRARRCSSGKSTWTLSHCAWKAAKRPVMVWKRLAHASRDPHICGKSDAAIAVARRKIEVGNAAVAGMARVDGKMGRAVEL